MSLKIPAKLKKGNTIGFISPSAGLAPFAMHRIEMAVKVFEKMGYKVKIGENALKNNGYVSASVEDRVSDIHKMFLDPEVKMIIATIGGNHSNQLLKFLNYNLIKKNPKIFIGYSDITVLHFAFQSRANLATYYGPCAMTQFGEYPEILDYTFVHFKRAICEGNKDTSYEIKPSEFWTDEFLDWFKKDDVKRARRLERNNGYEWLRSGYTEGQLLGGSIPSINHLAGTKYWCDSKDKIYFIDIPEGHVPYEGIPLQDVDSFLADLYNLGVFDNIKGLIIGRPYHYSFQQNEQLKQIILKYSFGKKYPILYNVNIGHVDPITTIRYGSVIALDSGRNSFKIIS